MHSGLKRSLLIFLSLAVMSVGLAPRPAYAVADCDMCVVSAVKLWLNTTILGTRAANKVFPNMVPGETPGADSVPIPSGAKVIGLVDYFEDVFWPRWISMEQRKWQVNDQTNAVSQVMAQRTGEAQQVNRHFTRLDNYRVDTAAGNLGLEDAICPTPSRVQSFIALRTLSQIDEIKDQIESAQMMAGSIEEYWEGRIALLEGMMRDRIKYKVCSKTGSNKADENWCQETDGTLEGADWGPQNLIHAISLVEGTDVRNNIAVAKMYINNIFYNKAFEPLSPGILASKDAQVMEVLAERSNYAALLSTFEQPFLEAKTQRVARAGVESADTLGKVLTRVGLPDEIKKRLIPSEKNISQAAAEEIYYKIANLDPQLFVSDYARAASLNQASRDSFDYGKFVDMVVLLYDIREQQKITNKLLGAIGSVMVTPNYERIQSASRNLTSGGSRQ